MASTSSHGDLPEDIILDILLRLPVKTLLQMKSVCKHWHVLIESPNFINRHFEHESNRERLLIRHYKPDEDQYAFALFSDDTLSGYEESDHLRNPVSVSALMGPVNGVFCVVGVRGHLSLLNPATRQFKPLESPHFDVGPHLSPYDDLLGFGLDVRTGSFKLVFIQYFWNEDTDVPYHPSLISVYNSDNDSWRQFEETDLVNSSRCAYRSLCNTYASGVYYWLTEFNDNGVAILAFDMSSERFQEIQVPDCIRSKEGDLALYGGSIALLSCDVDTMDKCVEVWVMSTEGCWSKTLSIGPFQDIRWPLGFFKENVLLLETGNSFLTVYDINRKKLRSVEAGRRENGFFIYWVYTYKESLVSLKGGRLVKALGCIF